LMAKNDENLIRKTCKELGLTYKQLGELIGYSESAINNASRQEKISEPLTFAINLYLENLKLKEELEDFRTLKKILTKTL
ncbi:transcriptional regulator, partial [Campylobacter jejuni]